MTSVNHKNQGYHNGQVIIVGTKIPLQYYTNQYEIGSNTKKMYSIKFLLIQTTLIFVGVVQAYDKYKVIETDSGPIRGVRNTTLLNGVIYYSFRGIPYAKPPIDDLRFKVCNYIPTIYFDVKNTIFTDRHRNQLSHGTRKFLMHSTTAINVMNTSFTFVMIIQ